MMPNYLYFSVKTNSFFKVVKTHFSTFSSLSFTLITPDTFTNKSLGVLKKSEHFNFLKGKFKRNFHLNCLLLCVNSKQRQCVVDVKMKLNERTVIKGNLVVLVPYEEYHVPKYHEWMKSEELQVLTASEPLTIEEEYEMQKSWRIDSDKCTFIVLEKSVYDESKNEIDAMVGDTNIFLRREENSVVGEIEIMIAESLARGKGLGKEAVLLMLRYGVENLGISIYEAKIGMNNTKSILLFTKLGFDKVCENKVFQEITFEKKVTDTWTQWLSTQTVFYNKEERKENF